MEVSHCGFMVAIMVFKRNVNGKEKKKKRLYTMATPIELDRGEEDVIALKAADDEEDGST